jgi:MOSC domain-containing protein YiiM
MLLKYVFAGLPKTVGDKEAATPMEREWTSAIFKEPVEGAVWVGKTGLNGDGQADMENHGGTEKAVLGYSLENYTYWRNELGTSALSSGGMGENFVMENVSEDSISIGDTFQIGEAIVQVSQPRIPCWKPGRRFKIKQLPLLMQNSGKTGWYFRILKEGHVEKGQEFSLLERPYPQWTIAECNRILHSKTPDLEKMRELSQCDLIAQVMKSILEKRIKLKVAPDVTKRVIGPNEE